MPWKAFMQSSALTNSDNQLANELFMQRENASCSLNIAPKWGDSLFELFCCHLGDLIGSQARKDRRRMFIQAHLAIFYHSTLSFRITPSVASSAVKVSPLYCTQSITSGSVPLLRTERLPSGATLTTLPS